MAQWQKTQLLILSSRVRIPLLARNLKLRRSPRGEARAQCPGENPREVVKPARPWGTCGLYYKIFTIVIYDRNPIGQYYKALIVDYDRS